MLDLLHQHVPKRLVGRVMLCLDTSQGRLEHPSAHTALRRQADRGVLGSVFEIALPRAGSARNVEQHIASWIALLSHEDQRPERRRIERPPPAERETMSTSREVLRVLLADTANFRDSASVGRALAGDPLHRNPKMVASRARKRGLIFGVWDGNAYRYPSFQFDGVGQPRADVADLLVVLSRDADGSGRDAALWLFAPDAALDDRAPYEVFA